MATELKTIKCGEIFQVLMAPSMKMTAFWNNAPYSLVEDDRRFSGDYGGNTHL
jgi:hypothetical protein